MVKETNKANLKIEQEYKRKTKTWIKKGGGESWS